MAGTIPQDTEADQTRITMARPYEAVIFDLYDTLIYHGRYTDLHLRLFKDLGLDRKEIIRAQKIAMTEDFKDFAELAKKIAPNKTIDTKSYEDELSKETATAAFFPETLSVLKC